MTPSQRAEQVATTIEDLVLEIGRAQRWRVVEAIERAITEAVAASGPARVFELLREQHPEACSVDLQITQETPVSRYYARAWSSGGGVDEISRGDNVATAIADLAKKLAIK